MDYQLVLQLPAKSLADFDEMVVLENAISNRLGNLGVVDGHDFGSGETNIFIMTNDPIQAFKTITSFLGTRDFMPEVKVAYRKVGDNNFTGIYPEDLRGFTIA